jgi:hypothetical protein
MICNVDEKLSPLSTKQICSREAQRKTNLRNVIA